MSVDEVFKRELASDEGYELSRKAWKKIKRKFKLKSDIMEPEGTRGIYGMIRTSELSMDVADEIIKILKDSGIPFEITERGNIFVGYSLIIG